MKGKCLEDQAAESLGKDLQGQYIYNNPYLTSCEANTHRRLPSDVYW
jgi:hypothetical protein